MLFAVIVWIVFIGLMAVAVHLLWPWTWTGKRKSINIHPRRKDWDD